MEKKYQGLRIISMIYKAIAVLLLLLSVIGAIGAFVAVRYVSPTGSPDNIGASILAAGAALFSGLIITITMYATANLIDLLIATEENTRATAILLNRLVRQPPARTGLTGMLDPTKVSQPQ